MKFVFLPRHLLLVALAGMFLTGCLFKPVTDSTRHFVLTPIPADDPTAASTRHLTVGIRPVRMPSQLLGESVSVRNGTNEIEYLHNAVWADRLDHAFERALAANLSRLLSSDGIYVDDWGRDRVMARVLVNVQQFEVDAQGKGTLIAQWQITAPGKDLPLKRGLARLARTGAAPDGKPEIIATTLSDLAADFSRQLAQEINESAQKYAWAD
jgi:uncharacterized lipoprotein YmbA